MTEGDAIAKGFCDFFCNVGPELAAKIQGGRKGAFLDYMGDRVNTDIHWRPTTPLEVENQCHG